MVMTLAKFLALFLGACPSEAARIEAFERENKHRVSTAQRFRLTYDSDGDGVLNEVELAKAFPEGFGFKQSDEEAKKKDTKETKMNKDIEMNGNASPPALQEQSTASSAEGYLQGAAAPSALSQEAMTSSSSSQLMPPKPQASAQNIPSVTQTRPTQGGTQTVRTTSSNKNARTPQDAPERTTSSNNLATTLQGALVRTTSSNKNARTPQGALVRTTSSNNIARMPQGAPVRTTSSNTIPSEPSAHPVKGNMAQTFFQHLGSPDWWDVDSFESIVRCCPVKECINPKDTLLAKMLARKEPLKAETPLLEYAQAILRTAFDVKEIIATAMQFLEGSVSAEQQYWIGCFRACAINMVKDPAIFAREMMLDDGESCFD